ncbi:MAG: glycosyltransferase family 39 protein [Halorientalis sp.]
MQLPDSDDRLPWWSGVAFLAAVAAVCVWLIATDVFPYHSLDHDEGVYLQQAAMLLDGRLFLHPPVPDAFRPWFFVRDHTTLYPKYAPVPAAVFALGMAVGHAHIALAGVAAAIVALVALVVAELFDEATGLLAGFVVLCSPLFLIQSALFLPYAPTTMLTLAFAYCYLRADRTDSLRWAGAAGAAIGLAFFARPYTTVLWSLPFVGHALWTLLADRDTLARHVATAGLGLAGVGLALGYNAVVTGSPFRFPYAAFAPRDGLGFGHHVILSHAVDYTVGLALQANWRVLTHLATGWLAGGLLGTVVAIAGLAVAVRRGLTGRQAILVGDIVTVVAGNVYFWGNYNLLGVLDQPGDGLIVTHGPFYHFDLLVPFGAFAAVALLALFRAVRQASEHWSRVSPVVVRVSLAAVVLVSALALGAPTATALDGHVQRNMVATNTYQRVYEPVETTRFDDALVFLPTPYGDWLNHPFQTLRNDPDFDGSVVYALDDHPFEVVDSYPNRSLYRLAYRGQWAPYDGSPRAARLQQVEAVRGKTVTLTATVGIPQSAESVSTTVTTANTSRTRVVTTESRSGTVHLRFETDRVRVAGSAWRNTSWVSVAPRDDVDVTVFVDRGPGASFSYHLDSPVQYANGSVRLLTPRIERCVAVQNCGGSGAYVPELAPSDQFVRTSIETSETRP